MIAYNAVYQYVDDGKRIRVLDLDYDANFCVYIPFEGMRMPEREKLETLEALIESHELIEIVDPFYDVDIKEDYSDIDDQRCEERYEIIRKYWPNQKERLLNKTTRGATLHEIALEENVQLFTLKRIFSQFWQQGMRKSALYTSYSNSGAKGKKRKIENKCGTKRADGNTGLIIDERIENIFSTVIKRYYEIEKKPSLRRVYYQMLTDYFSKSLSTGGEKKGYLYDEDHYPTFRQFEYYFHKNINQTESYIARETLNKYQLKRRPLKDTTTNQVSGPGDCFMIDSTLGDIHLVSKCNSNKVIGRPTIYIIIDVYSRLITGCYIGLENPSWDAVSLALINMVEDKVEFCKSRGISINEQDWPCHHLPRALLADRGDMISKRAEGLINELSVIVQNTAPYRGDLKGIVERIFGQLNGHLRETLPGGIQKDHPQRGDKDPRAEAALTIEDCERIIINAILLHNASIIEGYPSTPEQIKAGVPAVPLNLWEYGIATRGNLRIASLEKMSINLWPHEKASLGRKGLRFRNLFYGDIPLSLMFEASKGPVKMEIAYNPFTTNYIYVSMNGSFRQVRLQPSCAQFENMSFSEYEDYRKADLANAATVKRDTTQRRAEFEGKLQEEKRNAEKRKKELPKITKASRTANMHEVRLQDKLDKRRESTAETPKGKQADVVSIGKQPPSDYMELMQADTATLMDDLFGEKKNGESCL